MVFPNLDVFRKFNSTLVAISGKFGYNLIPTGP